MNFDEIVEVGPISAIEIADGAFFEHLKVHYCFYKL